MGLNINKTIKTELHYKDIALIVVALCGYQNNYKDTANPEILKRAKNLVNRLGNKMCDCE